MFSGYSEDFNRKNMIEPLGDRVLIKQFVESEEKTPSGIIVNFVEGKKKNNGEIVKIGCGEKVKLMNLCEGDKVIFEGWGGEPIDKDLIGVENLFIINYDKLIARYD